MRNILKFQLLAVFAVSLMLTACYPSVEYAEVHDWTLDGSGIVSIDATTSNGSIRVTGTSGDQVLVQARKVIRAYSEGQAADFAKQVVVTAERDGDTVRIFKEQPKFKRGVQVMVSYEIQAPKAVSVRLHTSNGKITIEQTQGTVFAKTSNGAIQLNGDSDNVELATSNGKVIVVGAHGTVDAHTSNGSIDYQGSADTITLRTSNGKILAALHGPADAGRFSTSNGAIDVAVPSGYNGEVDAHTSNGSIRCDLPVTIAPGGKSKRKLVGQIGSGIGSRLSMQTSNGSIHLRQGN